MSNVILSSASCGRRYFFALLSSGFACFALSCWLFSNSFALRYLSFVIICLINFGIKFSLEKKKKKKNVMPWFRKTAARRSTRPIYEGDDSFPSESINSCGAPLLQPGGEGFRNRETGALVAGVDFHELLAGRPPTQSWFPCTAAMCKLLFLLCVLALGAFIASMVGFGGQLFQYYESDLHGRTNADSTKICFLLNHTLLHLKDGWWGETAEPQLPKFPLQHAGYGQDEILST